MPTPLYRRRATGAPGNLPVVAVRDGAQVAYAFNQPTGTTEPNLGSGGSAYDITSVGAQTTQQVYAAGYPDRAGYKFIETNPGGGSPYGHASAPRPSQDGHTKVCYEVVFQCDKDNVPTARTLIDVKWVAVTGLASLYFATDGQMRTIIALTGGYDQVWSGVTANGVCRRFNHFVWQYDGADYTGWFNGVKQFTVTTGIGAATMSDDVLQVNRRMDIGGIQTGASDNIGATTSFFAQYPDFVLTPAQIYTHYKNAGVT